MSRLVVFAWCLKLVLALPSSQQPLLQPDAVQYGSNIDSAIRNANSIFNAVHSSMRQWGSSIQHNGMSIFPAHVPEGTLLYHGTDFSEPITGMEWLAFEIEHAESFAVGPRRGRPPPKRPEDPGDRPEGPHPPGEAFNSFWERGEADDEGPRWEAGYLHMYRTTRPLRLLYLDGMSAGKSSFGTLDTQDLLLLNDSTTPMREFARATKLCSLGKEWGIEGFIRMEAGFEIIKCNFSDGLEFVSHTKGPNTENPELNGRSLFEYVRGISSRYQGIGGNRVSLDYSSMISAFFYPVNLTNPDSSRSNLPRLVSSDPIQLSHINSNLKDLLDRKEDHVIIDWQGVVDMIVTRYIERLRHMATATTHSSQLAVINALLNTFIDYNSFSVAASVEKCSVHFLTPVHPSTEQDELIYTAIKAVTNKICGTLFDAREALLADDGESTIATSIKAIRDLNEWLDWPGWKACGPCDFDQVCFVAMWPFGGIEDHFNPRCKNLTEVNNRNSGYWNFPGRLEI